MASVALNSYLPKVECNNMSGPSTLTPCTVHTVGRHA